MALGNGKYTSGNKGSGYNYEVRVLKSLDLIVQAVNNIPTAGDATAANQVIQINQQQTTSFGVSTADVLEQIQIQAQAITLNTAYLDVPLSEVGYNYGLSQTLGEMLGNGSSGETTISALEYIMARLLSIEGYTNNLIDYAFSGRGVAELLFDGTGSFSSAAELLSLIRSSISQLQLDWKARPKGSNMNTISFRDSSLANLLVAIDNWRAGAGASLYSVSESMIQDYGSSDFIYVIGYANI